MRADVVRAAAPKALTSIKSRSSRVRQRQTFRRHDESEPTRLEGLLSLTGRSQTLQPPDLRVAPLPRKACVTHPAAPSTADITDPAECYAGQRPPLSSERVALASAQTRTSWAPRTDGVSQRSIAPRKLSRNVNRAAVHTTVTQSHALATAAAVANRSRPAAAAPLTSLAAALEALSTATDRVTSTAPAHHTDASDAAAAAAAALTASAARAALASAFERVADAVRLLGTGAGAAITDARWQPALAALAVAEPPLPAGPIVLAVPDHGWSALLASATWAHVAMGVSVPADLAARAIAFAQLPSQQGASPWRAKLSWALMRLQHHGAADVHAGMGVPWELALGFLPDLRLSDLLAEIRLRQDTILLEGREVQESRRTTWQSECGVTFLYSGKEMQPDEGGLSPQITAIRDALERRFGVHYDSVLVNHYPDGKAGMRYHSDPLYGIWSSDTAVVSLGDTREFVFRPVPLAPRAAAAKGPAPVHYRYLVSNGDAVRMTADCQERWQHCIKVEREAAFAGPRVSLVYKRLLRRPCA